MTSLLHAFVTLIPGALTTQTCAHEWTSLDRAITTWSASDASTASAPSWSGWIRSRYANSSDVDVSADPGGQDLGGFNLDSARLILSGEAAPGFNYTISAESGDPSVSDTTGVAFDLFDAYAAVALGEWGSVSIGRFSSTVLWSSGIEERRLAFLDRTFLGEVWDGRDVGFELSGAVDRFHWWTAVQNGSDSVADELALSARLSYHALGESPHGREGAIGLAADEEHLTIGIGWSDDRSLEDGSAWGGDMLFAKGRWSASAEVVDFEEDLLPSVTVNTSTGVLIPSGPTAGGADTPWNATLAYLLVPDRWEIAARWQDMDDEADTRVATAALSRYFAGHDAKWTLQFDTSSSGLDALDVDALAIGLTVGF